MTIERMLELLELYSDNSMVLIVLVGFLLKKFFFSDLFRFIDKIEQLVEKDFELKERKTRALETLAALDPTSLLTQFQGLNSDVKVIAESARLAATTILGKVKVQLEKQDRTKGERETPEK